MKDVELGQAMREGMRRLASGVCVVSARAESGQRYAMTATSVTSISDDPASLLVCINRDTSMFKAIEDGAPFVINVLHREQEDVSNRCASGDQGEGRFEVGEWLERDGLPYLDGSLTVFICEQAKSIDYGTHRILIGNINGALVSEEEKIDPLVYLDGAYRNV